MEPLCEAQPLDLKPPPTPKRPLALNHRLSSRNPPPPLYRPGSPAPAQQSRNLHLNGDADCFHRHAESACDLTLGFKEVEADAVLVLAQILVRTDLFG